VIGNDAAVLQAAHGGVFELNMMMPVAGHNLLEAIALLAAAARNFADQCVAGLKATENGPAMVERGLMLGTALVPAVGYDKSAEIAKTAAKTGRTIREVAREETQLSEEELDQLLNPVGMTEPGFGGGPASG
jgi:fumarate hydratase class II